MKALIRVTRLTTYASIVEMPKERFDSLKKNLDATRLDVAVSTDLNAIALAEKKLNQKQWNDLIERLKNLSNDGSFWSLKRILQFEPRQRAEALVSVIQNLETQETTLE